MSEDPIKVPAFSEEQSRYTTEQRSRLMSKIRSSDTKPELQLRRALGFGVPLPEERRGLARQARHRHQKLQSGRLRRRRILHGYDQWISNTA